MDLDLKGGGKDMLKYETPIMEEVLFEKEDIIRTSGYDGTETDPDWG